MQISVEITNVIVDPEFNAAEIIITPIFSSGEGATGIQSISKNGTPIIPIGGNVDITVPTKTSDLTNDSDFVSDANYVHTDNNYDNASALEVAKIVEKANSSDVYTKSETYTQTEINNKLSAVYEFKGSVLTYAALPTDAENADVYNVEENGVNYAWVEASESWDSLGGLIGLATLTENGLLSKEDFAALAALKIHDHAGQVINPEGIKLDTVNPLVVANAGEIGWNATDGTVNLQLLNNTKLQIGQELHIYGKASEAINNRDVIQFAGVQGDHILIKKAVQSEIAVNPTLIMGIATQNIASNNFGYVTWFGKVNDVFTTGFSLSDMLYFDSSGVVAGAITNVAPTAPNRKILLATVIKLQTGASENGIIMVRPTFGTKLADLDDVDGTEPETGSILVYNQTLGVHDFTAKVSDFATSGHTHTGIYSSLSMNVLTAGAGAAEYTLLRNIQTNILNTLPSGVNSTITLPASVAGELNESVLHFSTGAVIPTLVYNGFTPVWLGGTSLVLKINKTYTIVFEQVRTSTGVWTVKTSFGEY